LRSTCCARSHSKTLARWGMVFCRCKSFALTYTMTKKTQLRQHLRFTKQELPSLIGVFSVVAFLHIAGWGLFIHFNSNPAYSSLTNSSGALVYAGAGALAYSFGLRHAFDADHIAAIDDTTRLMLAKGKNPLALGLFFSLGHSTIVMAMRRCCICCPPSG